MPKIGPGQSVNREMSNMRQILKEEVARKGPISFARFMELALYCPNFGYYEQLDSSPGRKGDFYTSVSVGPLFGELLAAQFAQWRGENAECGVRNAEWQIMEAGAHDGQLAVDILRWLKANRTELFRSLEYRILEPSALRQKSQRETLGELAGFVRWFTSWGDLPPTGVHGVIFANELLDAMPVHRLGWDAVSQKWFEWGVACAGDEFSWTKIPEAVNSDLWNSALRAPHSALLSVLPDGFTMEVCPAASEWWGEAARALKTGTLMTFDYGLDAEQFFTPERRDGTLRAYYQHHQSNDLLARPGEQDLTAQLNFTAIREAGESQGLKTETFETQAQFLTHVVAKAANEPGFQEWFKAHTRQFQTLTHPEHLGRSFSVLVQTR
jgi:SAM-dependent MidA family methyltransferase